jgi:hypothetical protein
MLSGALQWLANLTEVVIVALAILLSGLVIGMAAFWALARVLGKLSGQDPANDIDEEERDETGSEIGRAGGNGDDTGVPLG